MGGGMVGSEWRIPENSSHDLVTSIVVLLEGLGQADAEVDIAEGVDAEGFGFQSVDHRQIGKFQGVVDAVKFESGIVISDGLAIANLGGDGNGDAARSYQVKRIVLRDGFGVADAIETSGGSAIAIDPQSRRLLFELRHALPTKLASFNPFACPVDEMILSLMIVRNRTKQRDIDDVEQFGDAIVGVNAFPELQFGGGTMTHRADPGA
jgi:hypothetical protein